MIDTLLPGKDFGLIITAALALLFFYILNTFMQYIVTYFGHMLGLNIETDMRRDLFSHLQKQPFGFYDNQKTGKLMSRMTTDLFEIGEVAHHGPEDIFISIMSLFGAFFLMLNINVKLAISTFILVPILTVLIVYFNKRMTKVTTGIFKDLGILMLEWKMQLAGCVSCKHSPTNHMKKGVLECSTKRIVSQN